MSEWSTDQAFWDVFEPVMFDPKRFPSCAEEALKMAALAGITAGSALDLGCGPAAHAIALARAGFRVTAVDRVSGILDRARKLAAVNNAAVEWVQADLRTFARPASFDLILIMGTTFGYCETDAQNRAVLGLQFQNLRPGGALVIDLVSKERLLKALQPATHGRLNDGSDLYGRHEFIEEITKIREEWVRLNSGSVCRVTCEHYVYTGMEIRDRLRDAGFEVRLFGDSSGQPYGPSSPRLIAVGRKPAEGERA